MTAMGGDHPPPFASRTCDDARKPCPPPGTASVRLLLQFQHGRDNIELKGVTRKKCGANRDSGAKTRRT